MTVSATGPVARDIDVGIDNVASGFKALYANTHGRDNTAVGHLALSANRIGDSNIALGSGAGGNLTTGSGNVDIASAGVAGESGAIRIGTSGTQTAAFLAGVSGTSIAGPAQPVLVNSNGQLGTVSAASKLNSARLAGKLRRQSRHNRRQTSKIGQQAEQIASLQRQVAKLSKR